jgi:hypothetical protein
LRPCPRLFSFGCLKYHRYTIPLEKHMDQNRLYQNCCQTHRPL